MQSAKKMEEVGTQLNPDSPAKFVNVEGLKRVYKPKALREAEAMSLHQQLDSNDSNKQDAHIQQQQFITNRTSAKTFNTPLVKTKGVEAGIQANTLFPIDTNE